MSTHPPHKDYCSHFVGLDTHIPLLNGNSRPYINFDNAASTPPLKAVQETVNRFMAFYSSVHRGTGFKSQLSTHAYEEARHAVLKFLNADPLTHTCIFGKNTTEAINKLARRFPFTPQRDVVITSGMEHHSNDLPWRASAQVVHVALLPDGRLDLEDFTAQVQRHANRLALVAISGGSNVTGFINPIHQLAEQTHAVGAQIFVDAAQLAPHRPIDVRPIDDPAHLDYVAISAHKMYAPYGTGALVARRDTFQRGDPDMVGGGVVEIVTLEDVAWAAPPDRDEAGSPNTVGAIALGAAVTQLSRIGMSAVAAHEAALTRYALQRLPQVPGIHIYGDPDPNNADQRLGVIPFALQGLDHFLVAAILGHEFGIGVRNGCFCAHPLILHLLGASKQAADRVRQDVLAGDRSNMPGLIRASFGLYNTTAEIDALVDALTKIAAGDYQGEYRQDTATGEYHPLDWSPQYDKYFSLAS